MIGKRLLTGIALFLVIGSLTSCHQWTKQPVSDLHVEKKALDRISLPPNAVSIDVLIIHVPYQNRQLLQDLWQDVDEQELDWEARKNLNDHGFRAGIIGASIPESLSQLLTLKNRPLREKLEEEVALVQDESVPFTLSKPYILQRDTKSIIEISNEVIPSIPVLIREDNRFFGKSYDNARPLLTVSANPLSDGSVQFIVTPQLQYGSPKMATRYQHAQLIRTTEQPTKTFDYLKCSLSLRPGQFLVMGAQDERNQKLGRYFFTQGNDDYDQKLLVIRLIVTQNDGQFYHFPSFKEIVRGKSVSAWEESEPADTSNDVTRKKPADRSRETIFDKKDDSDGGDLSDLSQELDAMIEED